jgi:hypothetical protein
MAILRKHLVQIASAWMGLAFPLGCLALLFDNSRHWLDKHPFLTAVAVASFIGPLMVAGWLEYSRQKSRRIQQ